MFEISEQSILDQVEQKGTYQKGMLYYYNKRVQSFQWNENQLTIEALVWGTNSYDVEISLHKNGHIHNTFCTCAAFSGDEGACKHVVAVLKTAQAFFLKNKVNAVRTQSFTNQIFSMFEQMIEEEIKTLIQMEITFEITEEGYHEKRIMGGISLRMGEDRLYVVRSIKNLLLGIQSKKPIEFGKNFAFNPVKHMFSTHDQEIIHMLQELYEVEEASSSFSYNYNQGSIFKGKKVHLPEASIRRFIQLLKDHTFVMNVLGQEYQEVRIIEQDLPMEFHLTQVESDLLLKWDTKDPCIPLVKDGQYFFYKGNIYHVSEKQKKYFAPFYHAFGHSTQGIRFTAQQKERFVSEILPITRQIAEVVVDAQVEETFYEEELLVEMYLDKVDTGITAKTIFIYGEDKVDPFHPKQLRRADDKILIRDVEKEKKIMGILEQAEFKVGKEKVYIGEEEKIFQFLYFILPKLQKEASVYYSEDFKNITVKDPRTFSAGVRLNEKSNMLEVSFDFEDVDKEELRHIFGSLREKRKYYRLKNGSFLPLEDGNLQQISDMIEYLDMDKELDQKVIRLPAYRAMYIDNHLREGNLHHVERNLPFKQLVQNIREPGDMEYEIPTEVTDTLREYQKLGFKWLKTLSIYGLGGILADDMGLGKTLQTITFILSQKEKNEGPSLVIAPTSLVYNWQDEVLKFAPELRVLVVSGSQKTRQEQLQDIQAVDMVVTSYPLIRRDIELYESFQFSYCFLDEAQHIKNPESINARSVKKIQAKGYFALTGTPIENSLTELWSIFDFVMPGYLLSHHKFMKKYERPIMKNQDQKALQELSKHIKPFILRRMKKDVLKELPEKIESKMSAQLVEEQKKIYMAYLQDIKGEIAKELADNGFEKSQMKILAALTRLRQICCHPAMFLENYTEGSGKLLLLEEIIEDALESNHRILLFSQFTSMLHIIKQVLDRQQISYFYLDGKTKIEQRGEMVKAFNQGEKSMFLISLKAGGTGLNLTGADMVIHYDPWWNPAVEEQATDRAYRIGQENVVQVIKLITQGTIEEKIYELQQKKKEMIQSVIQPGETMLSKMTEQEIKGLFEL